MEKRFDEGFDNILTYHYDDAYQKGRKLDASTLVTDCGRKKISLNGGWHFSPDVFSSTVRSRWFDETRFNRNGEPLPYDADFENWDEIQVPGVWNSQKKEYALYEGAGVYFRTFQRKDLENQGLLMKPGNRLFLRIGGANYETRIWLNRKYLGRHLGGFTPFCADLTEYLEDENRLLIFVDNTRKGGQVPSMHYDWFNYGGIFRDVELFETPELHIKDIFVQLSGAVPGRMEYRIRAEMPGTSLQPSEVRAEIHLPELNISQEVLCRKEKQPDTALYAAEGSFKIDENIIEKWSPQNPVLYQVIVALYGNTENHAVDQTEEQIGFRRIRREGHRILLNDSEVFLKGMCVHEESDKSFRCVTEQEIEDMIRQVKELGCNFLRLTHYPHSEKVSRTADRMGILLLEEIPVYWALEFENPDTYADAANQLTELIRRDINRASVILWSVGNENPDSDARYHFMKNLVYTARKLDPGRLIAASCLIDVDQKKIRDRLIEELDVVGINEYYGWYLKDFENLEKILERYREEKPLIITETGADAVCGYFSESREIYSEELQAQIYERQFETLFQYDFIRGVTPWILYDYRSMRRMSTLQKGYNLKGIIGSDRRYKKKAYYVVKEAYARK